MDRIDRSMVALAGIMMAVLALVNAQATETPNFNRAARKAEPKDSVNDIKSEIAQLVDLLLKNGEEDDIKEHLAPVIGLPGPMSDKASQTYNEEHHGKNLSEHECFVVYEASSDATLSKRPFCIFLHKHEISGHNDYSQYFRVNLNGQLEKIVMIRGKRDNDGKTVRGASVPTDQDIESSASKKEFATEMAAMRKWFKTQKKLFAKANAAKPNEAAVKVHAETEQQAVDHEAAAAPTASPSAPTAP